MPEDVGMLMSVLALALLVVVTFTTARDSVLGTRADRVLAAASWSVMGALGIWRGRYVGMTWTDISVGAVAVYGAVLVSSWGRPALVMDQLLSYESRRDPQLVRRGLAATIATLVSVAVVAAYMEFGT